jgi:hypothetical protein
MQKLPMAKTKKPETRNDITIMMFEYLNILLYNIHGYYFNMFTYKTY